VYQNTVQSHLMNPNFHLIQHVSIPKRIQFHPTRTSPNLARCEVGGGGVGVTLNTGFGVTLNIVYGPGFDVNTLNKGFGVTFSTGFPVTFNKRFAVTFKYSPNI
jgi:hypothetical protein